MNAGRNNKNGAGEHDGCVLGIPEAAALALKELDPLRSAAPLTQEALDREVARIAQEKLHPHGCDLAVQRRRNDLTRLLIKIRRGEAGYVLIRKFFRQE